MDTRKKTDEKPVAKEPKGITSQAAQAALNKDVEARRAKFAEVVKQASEEYMMTIVPWRRETQQGIQFGLDIVPAQ